jgi:hypothetical protein
MRRAPAICVLLSVLVLTTSAQAQDAGGTPNMPPPGTPDLPPPAPPPSAPAQPVVQAAPAPRAAPRPHRDGDEDDDDAQDRGRLRIGFNLNGGTGAGGNFHGVVLGGTFRAGYQIDRLMAVYGQITGFGWLATTDATYQGKSFDVSAVSGYHFTPMFSLTPHYLIELAAGPSLDKLAGGDASTSVAGSTITQSVSVHEGFYFGLHGRIALHIAGKPSSTGRRTSFTIGFDVHPTFAEGNTLTFYTVGLGADWY